ncbi:hypothetical protein CerSpe_072960 [Prunus speciosa]
MAATDDGLKKLEYLSLVSKVGSELETHIGVGDKVLAEFITELGRNCETVDEFDTQIREKRCRDARLLCPYTPHYHSRYSSTEAKAGEGLEERERF